MLVLVKLSGWVTDMAILLSILIQMCKIFNHKKITFSFNYKKIMFKKINFLGSDLWLVILVYAMAIFFLSNRSIIFFFLLSFEQPHPSSGLDLFPSVQTETSSSC